MIELGCHLDDENCDSAKSSKETLDVVLRTDNHSPRIIPQRGSEKRIKVVENLLVVVSLRGTREFD